MNAVRYAKQIKLKGFGLPAQQLLKNSRVLIVGAGGLGTPCAQYLNAAGVGTIGLIDADTISLSNLPRQTLFDEAEVGLSKIEVLSKKLNAQNPATTFICYPEFLSPENALATIKGYDVVIDASDNFGTRYLVNDSCVILNKPFIYGALHEFEGQVSVLNYQQGPTYRCLFEETAGMTALLNCDDNGVLGILPALIGTYQAIETIKIITGIGEPLNGQLLIIDTLTQSHFKISVQLKAVNKNITALKTSYHTPQCGIDLSLINATTLQGWIMLQKKIQLIDVRTEAEFGTAHFPDSKNIPLHNLLLRQAEIDILLPVVFICQSGARSQQAINLLQKDNSNYQLYSLQGGLSSTL